MKLCYAPRACSLCPQIIARETGIELALENVDLGSKKIGTAPLCGRNG
jgi:hypothetical protein